MMKKYSYFKGIFFIAIVALLSSCGQLNIQKRQYSGGWTIFSGKGVKSEQPVARQHRKPARSAIAAPQNGTAQAIEMPAPESFAGMSENQTQVPATLNRAPEVATVKMNLIQKLALKKALKNMQPAHVAKAQNSSTQGTNDGRQDDTEMLLLIILAIFIPPLAVLYYEDWEITLNFWLCLLFWLLLILPGIIYAFWVIFGDGGVA